MMSDTASDRPRAFLSYSRRDSAKAEQILTALEERGVEVFRDTEDILPAEDWRGRLDGLIGAADAIVFLMSPNSVRSEVCSWEVHLSGALNKRLVPVLLAPVDDAITPPEVARLNYVFATPDRDFADAMNRVAAAVQTDIGWMRDHTRLGERAREWDRAARPRASLLRGQDLTGAERWLSSQPAAAPAPTALTREWIGASRAAAVRRQRFWVAGSLVVAAVSIGLGIVAEVNRRIAAEQRDRAERILDRSSKTANDLVFDMAQRFRDRAGVPQELVEDLLGRSRALLDQLAEAGEDRPDLIRSRAAALTEMSVTLARRGALDAALDAARQANAHFTALAADGAAASEADLAVGLDREGDILVRQGDLEAAEARFRAAHAINARIGGAGAPAAWRINLAVSEEKLGDMALARSDAPAALAAFDRAMTLRDTVEARGRGTAILLEKQGDALVFSNDVEAAMAAYEASLSLTTAAAEAAPDDTALMRDLSVIRQKLGDLVAQTEGAEAATEHFEADLEIARRLHRLDPGREDWALDLATSLDRLGVARFQTGDAEAALALIVEATEVASALATRDPRRVDLQTAATGAAQKASLVAFALGDYALAAGVARDDAARMAPLGEAELYADAVNNVAWYGLFTGDPSDALAAAEEAVSLDAENQGYLMNRAHALMFAGDFIEASKIYASRKDEAWLALLASDIEAFAAAGLSHPPVDGIAAAPE